MAEHILIGIVSVIALGVGAQWLAWRFKVPSILLLLVFGFLAGPVTGLLEPSSLQGDWVFSFVSISIGIILFEGGLTLRLSELREVGRSVLNLITVGVLLTWLLAGLAAYYVAGFNLSLAVLVGAILTVTGPTVVIPLLRHVRPTGRVGTIAKWEGITIDPVGAILSVLVLEAILLLNTGKAGEGFGEAISHAVMGLFSEIFVSLGVSITGAGLLTLLLRRRLVPDYLMTPMALTLVLAAFALANALKEESGLLTATLMGIIMANQPYVSVKSIAKFKEDLQVLLVACLFIVLSARLELEVLAYIDRRALLFLALLILVVRPLSVFVSTWNVRMTWKEQAFMAWLAPRGIVAAAVASLFSFRLEAIYPAQVDRVVPIIFLVIVGTVAVYGLTITPLARYLGLAEPDAKGLLILGAHPWARRIAQAVASLGFPVLLIDTNAKNVAQAQAEGLQAVVANALSETIIDEVELGGYGHLLAMTSNDEVNALAVLNFLEIFDSTHLYQLAPRSEVDRQQDGTLPRHLRGRPLFGEGMTHATLTQRFNAGYEVKTFTLTEEQTYEAIQQRYDGKAVPLFVARGESDLRVVSETEGLTMEPGDTVVVFVPMTQSTEPAQDVDSFERLVTHAFVIDLDDSAVTYEDIVDQAASLLAQRLPLTADELAAHLRQSRRGMPIMHGAALLHSRIPHIQRPEMVLVRCRHGLRITDDHAGAPNAQAHVKVYVLFFLISPQEDPRQHLRTLAHIASRIDDWASFLAEWQAAADEQQLKETLLHHDRFLALDLHPGTPPAALIGQSIADLGLPPGCRIALIHRADDIIVPDHDIVLEAGDRATIVGNTAGIHRLYGQLHPHA